MTCSWNQSWYFLRRFTPSACCSSVTVGVYSEFVVNICFNIQAGFFFLKVANCSYFESNLWIENRVLAEFSRILFDERIKQSVPLISVGGPVESIAHVFAYGRVIIFRMALFPLLFNADLRPLYSQEAFRSCYKSLKGSLTWSIRNWRVICRINQLRRFLSRRGYLSVICTKFKENWCIYLVSLAVGFWTPIWRLCEHAVLGRSSSKSTDSIPFPAKTRVINIQKSEKRREFEFECLAGYMGLRPWYSSPVRWPHGKSAWAAASDLILPNVAKKKPQKVYHVRQSCFQRVPLRENTDYPCRGEGKL